MEMSDTLGGTSNFDPFAKPPESTETKEGLEHGQALPCRQPSSPVELDLFGDPSPSSKQNGTKEPDVFDLGVLGEALTQPGREARSCRTPESFLGPSASSLVNLDSLVKAPQAAKSRNPFLTGLSAPSPSNPFGPGEQGQPALSQMRTGSPARGLSTDPGLGRPPQLLEPQPDDVPGAETTPS
ncbi:PREDICTED: epsin-3-like [Galeopterus variegatus]|uniref:Epsin-3-like n=1 Tax=Galeopterus variegatus TaxID=482537 RepID=A0ABM0Q3N3_GALVR|nr:PREDICTED: epsin-3-like [Galeopterus variegatus]